MTAPHSKLLIGAGGLLWLALVLAGFRHTLAYGAGAGPQSSPPAQWPVDSRLAREARADTLVMFVHPHCPCSRASLNELTRLLAESEGQLRAVVLLEPEGLDDDARTRTSAWRQASASPLTRVEVDAQGSEARRFGAQTSGMAAIYDREGLLRFAGGLTGSRGHEGENMGHRKALEAVLKGGSPPSHAPVFGCALATASEQEQP